MGAELETKLRRLTARGQQAGGGGPGAKPTCLPPSALAPRNTQPHRVGGGRPQFPTVRADGAEEESTPAASPRNGKRRHRRGCSFLGAWGAGIGVSFSVHRAATVTPPSLGRKPLSVLGALGGRVRGALVQRPCRPPSGEPLLTGCHAARLPARSLTNAHPNPRPRGQLICKGDVPSSQSVLQGVRCMCVCTCECMCVCVSGTPSSRAQEVGPRRDLAGDML